MAVTYSVQNIFVVNTVAVHIYIISYIRSYGWLDINHQTIKIIEELKTEQQA